MITNQRRAAFLGRIGSLALVGWIAAAACSSGGGGSPGTGGSGGGNAGTTGAGGGAGTSAGGTTGAGGGATGGTGGSSTGSGGATGGTGAGGTAGTGGATGGAGGTAGGAGGVAGTSVGGSGGAAGGGGGATGGGGAGGAGGATNCAGHAISFNANVAANNDPAKANVNVPINTDIPTGNANRTIEFWAYVLTSSWAADANTMFFYGTNNRNNDGFGFDFGITSNGIGTIDPFTNNSTTDPLGDNKPSGLMANMNQWAHFAMTWDGTNLHAYVNGVEKVTVAIPAMLHTGTSAPLTIGGYPPAYFNGYIDEFRIWNVAHTAAEITATMNKTLVGNEPGLVAYYKFDETSGTTAADSVTTSGHTAHPGTLMANTTANNPTFVVSTAPLSCP
jgi:hypothetical protein